MSVPSSGIEKFSVAFCGFLVGFIIEHRLDFVRLNSASVDGLIGAAVTVGAAYWIGVVITRKNNKIDRLKEALAKEAETLMIMIDGQSAHHDAWTMEKPNDFPLAKKEVKRDLQRLMTRIQIVKRLAESLYPHDDKVSTTIDLIEKSSEKLSMIWTSPSDLGANGIPTAVVKFRDIISELHERCAELFCHTLRSE